MADERPPPRCSFRNVCDDHDVPRTRSVIARRAASLAIALIATAVAGCGSSPTQTQSETGPEGTATPTSEATVFGLISDTKRLSTLTAGLAAAGLVTRLEGAGPYTVFAPTNEAWDQLGESRVEALMTTQSKNLRQGLLNHIAEGTVLSADLTDGRRLRSLGGPPLVVRVQGDTITVSGARIVTPNQLADNGVVHVVDKVIR